MKAPAPRDAMTPARKVVVTGTQAQARVSRLHLRPDALQGLVLAAQLGSVRRAARMLGLSQPGLSKLLHELEVELGAPLLVRSFRGVAPTPQGQAVLGPARRICEELRELHQRIGGATSAWSDAWPGRPG